MAKPSPAAIHRSKMIPFLNARFIPMTAARKVRIALILTWGIALTIPFCFYGYDAGNVSLLQPKWCLALPTLEIFGQLVHLQSAKTTGSHNCEK